MRELVSVVDDDESVRESLPDLLRSLGFEGLPFASAEAFLASDRLEDTDCLILDIAMPGMSGPELQQELSRRNLRIPIVFISAFLDEAVSSKLLRAGAVACLTKPFSEAAILKAVNEALSRD